MYFLYTLGESVRFERRTYYPPSILLNLLFYLTIIIGYYDDFPFGYQRESWYFYYLQSSHRYIYHHLYKRLIYFYYLEYPDDGKHIGGMM